MTSQPTSPERGPQLPIEWEPKPAPAPAVFHGASYVPHLDQARLETQLGRIVAFMLEVPGRYYTVAEIRAGLEARYPGGWFPENSVQAQLRNAKKAGYRKHKRRRGGAPAGKVGLYEFVLLPREIS